MIPDPNDWFVVNVDTGNPMTGLGAVIRYQHYDAGLVDEGVLRVSLADRNEVHLYAPGEWRHFVAKPAPADVAEQLDREEAGS